MTQWLVDTLVYTGVLIALVLLVRRPVSHYFGPQVAYALWALPFLRLLMPPITLPASLAPSGAAQAAQPLVIYLSDAPVQAGEVAGAVQPSGAGIALADVLLPLWLCGAAIFLVLRARDYFRMRRDLLADARPVGEAGRIRLVETPAISSPVAFGIGDKVIALPPEFMAHHDIAARDLALAHELAHHRGHDLVANIAVQPLLALHWFNPLAQWGWRAMRRDQEAACDARVVAGRERSERAAYAQVIAGFAAGPNCALAASMACPVLGEKSIIHRLRSLTMSDIPAGRKRLGIAAIATTALVALPLSASISYAQAEPPAAPQPPAVPHQPEAPQPPAAPRAPGAPSAVPVPPAPPVPAIDDGVPGSTVEVEIETDENGEVRRRVIRRTTTRHETSSGPDLAREAEISSARVEAEKMQRRSAEHREIVRIEALRAGENARHAQQLAHASVPQIEIGCEGEQVVQRRQLDNGHEVMVICQSAVNAKAALGIRQAQQAIRHAEGLTRSQREEIIRALDQEIERLESSAVSSASQPVFRYQARVFTPVSAPSAPVIPAVSAPAVPAPPPVMQVRRTASIRISFSGSNAPESPRRSAALVSAGMI